MATTSSGLPFTDEADSDISVIKSGWEVGGPCLGGWSVVLPLLTALMIQRGKGHRLSNPILIPDGVHLGKSWDPGEEGSESAPQAFRHEPQRVDSLSFPNRGPSHLKRSTSPLEVKGKFKFKKSPHDQVNPEGGM